MVEIVSKKQTTLVENFKNMLLKVSVESPTKVLQGR